LERRLSHDLPPATRRKRISPTTRYENNEKLIQTFYEYERLMALKEIRMRKPERTPIPLRKPLVLSEAKEDGRLILEEELAALRQQSAAGQAQRRGAADGASAGVAGVARAGTHTGR
jgi:hypothetical protein